MRVPSGLNHGVLSMPGALVRRDASPPVLGTHQRSPANWNTILSRLIVGWRIRYGEAGGAKASSASTGAARRARSSIAQDDTLGAFSPLMERRRGVGRLGLFFDESINRDGSRQIVTFIQQDELVQHPRPL